MLIVAVAFVIILLIALFFLTVGKEIGGQLIEQLFGIFFPRPPT